MYTLPHLNLKHLTELDVLTPYSVIHINEKALKRLTQNINQLLNVENKQCLQLTVSF